MIRPALRCDVPPALRRLAALAPLDAAAVAALQAALGRAITIRAHREIHSEGGAMPGPQLIVSGWAARVRILPDGRRQLISFLLPGDLVGQCGQPEPLSLSALTAMTDVSICSVPSTADAPPLASAYAHSVALEQAYLLEQITRLGRMNAQERIASLLLELHERLRLNGMADATGFDIPLTQEHIADALGLTSVHVNRTLQAMRRSDDLRWQGGRVTLTNPAALAHWLGRQPARVSGSAMRGA